VPLLLQVQRRSHQPNHQQHLRLAMPSLQAASLQLLVAQSSLQLQHHQSQPQVLLQLQLHFLPQCQYQLLLHCLSPPAHR
jgi:uncharacterized protein (DUF1684 family)